MLAAVQVVAAVAVEQEYVRRRKKRLNLKRKRRNIREKEKKKLVATRATSSFSLSTTSSVEALPPKMYSPAFCTSSAVALAVLLSVASVSVPGPEHA